MSKKIQIESNIFLDSDMGSYNYNENIVKTNYKDVLLYIDNGNLNSELDSLEILSEQYEKLLTLVKSSDVADEWEEVVEDSSLEDRDELMATFFKENFLTNKFYDREIIKKIDFLKENEIGSSWDKYDYVRTSGYSQGDERFTLINIEEAREVWGSEPDLESLQKNISNYIYDQPMTIKLIVNGEEYEGEKNGCYDEDENYNADEIKNYFFDLVKSDFPEIDDATLKETLDDVIPSEIESDSLGNKSLKTTIYLQDDLALDSLVKNLENATNNIANIQPNSSAFPILLDNMSENELLKITSDYKTPNELLQAMIGSDKDLGIHIYKNIVTNPNTSINDIRLMSKSDCDIQRLAVAEDFPMFIDELDDEEVQERLDILSDMIKDERNNSAYYSIAKKAEKTIENIHDYLKEENRELKVHEESQKEHYENEDKKINKKNKNRG